MAGAQASQAQGSKVRQSQLVRSLDLGPLERGTFLALKKRSEFLLDALPQIR